MKDREKPKRQLFAELGRLRRRIAVLEASETKHKRTEEALKKERELLKESLNLHERERKLAAYEIHDGLGQQLTAALLQLHAFNLRRKENPDEAQQTLDTAFQLLDDAVGETRRLIAGLGPPILDESGIVPAVDCLVREANQREGPEIEFLHSLQLDRLTPPLETAVFRIVQEALTNARRHSQSERVRVQLVGKNGHVRVEVQDWGIGFDPQRVEENRFGLRGIRERARLFGGRAAIDAAPGRGTRIIAEIPLSGKSSQ